MVHDLRTILRIAEGRNPDPTAVILNRYTAATALADYHSGQPVLNKTYSSRISFGFVLLAISMSSVVHYCSE